MLHVRRPFSEEFEVRKEKAWPLQGTNWKSIYLSAADMSMAWDSPKQASNSSFKALEDTLDFKSAPLEKETEITGPLMAKIFASSSTKDMDLFVTFMACSPEGKEVYFQGTIDPATPLGQGWLRASHRKLDKAKSLPYRPYHSHDEKQLLKPGEVYELQV